MGIGREPKFGRLIVLILAIAAQAPDVSPSGYWVNELGSVVVLIAPCGAEALCGTVQTANDKARADAKRGGTANLTGTELFHDFLPNGPGRWKGTVFVPDLNKRSRMEIVQLDANRIRVRGCAVGRLICKSQVWTRTTAPSGP